MAVILVVDDQTPNREVLASILKGRGHRVLEAPGGEAALGEMKRSHPDLLITDLLMPGMDGFELARRVRQDADLQATRIVFYTATYLHRETLDVAGTCGVRRVLSKPFDPHDVLAVVAEELAEPAASIPPNTEAFDAKHLMLITEKLSEKVAEIERVNRDLQRTTARYEALLGAVGDGIVVLDRKGRILLANASAARLFGAKQTELPGTSLHAVPHMDQRGVPCDGSACALREALESPHARTLEEVTLPGTDDRPRTIHVATVPLGRGEEGDLLVTMRDTTERRLAAERILELNASLERRVDERTAELSATNERLSASLTEIEQRSEGAALLSEMGGILQSCLTLEEVRQVLQQFSGRLFPSGHGGLYSRNPDGLLLERIAAWGADGAGAAASFAPEVCWAARRCRPHAVLRPLSDLRCGHVPEAPPSVSLCVPMMAQGETFGVLTQWYPESAGARVHPGSAEFQIAVSTAELLALILANLKMRRSLQEQALRDPLTGLFNRRNLEEMLDREVTRALRKKQPVGLMMLDVDHFKRLNDALGHESGDRALRALADLLRMHVRSGAEDLVCRYGGEEFVLVMPDSPRLNTLGRARRICEEASRLSATAPDGTTVPITVSIGVACCPENGASRPDLLRAADEALYRAKDRGRNQVVAATGDPETQEAAAGAAS